MTSGYAIATLVAFIISILFVIHPASIPTPRPLPRIPINLATAPILTIALLWAAQCIDPTVIRNGIVGTEAVKPYNILILFFSLTYMGVTLDITGVLRAAAFWVSNKSGQNGWKLYLYFYVMFIIVSIPIGNDPVILFGTAFLVYYTNVAELDPWAWLIGEFAATNLANMVLFVGSPSNVVICEGFSVNNATFTAYTILPFLACNVTCFAALALRFPKQVPRRLAVVPLRDPRTALRDPIGALVGGLMVGAMLVLCLVNFFGIDVWMISLPFAVAKLTFDLGWDYYRYSPSRVLIIDENLDPPPDMEGSQLKRRYSLHSPPHSLHSALPPLVDNPPLDMERSQLERRYSLHSSRHSSHSALPPPIDKKQLDVDLDTDFKMPYVCRWYRAYMADLQLRLLKRFPTVITALPRLPFSLVPFTFSQFILIEALDHQGWVHTFGNWLARASHREIHPTIWLIGALGVILCNICGTNIGATILLTKVVHAAALSHDANRAAAIALAVASNIGPVSLTISASLGGLLWCAILKQKGIQVQQRKFAFWNMLPLLVMITTGLGIVSAEMAVLFRPS